MHAYHEVCATLRKVNAGSVEVSPLMQRLEDYASSQGQGDLYIRVRSELPMGYY